MLMFINGSDKGPLKLFKSADAAAIVVRLVHDDGTPKVMTGCTATLEVYASKDRAAAAVASLTLTTVSATGGTLSVTPAIATTNFGPGKYFVFAKHVVTSGSVVTISDNNIELVVR